MITEDQVVAMFAKANPVPSLDLLQPVDLEHLEDRSERSGNVTELKTSENDDNARRWSRKPGPLVAAIAAVVVLAIGIGMFMASRGPQIAATPVDRATAFWVAMAAGDRETAIAHLEPAPADSGEANTFGRAPTLESQFDWYQVVGWEWTLEECIETAGGEVECTASASNAWSEALGVEPVTGTFVMEASENGFTRIVDKDESFLGQWTTMVFDLFVDWVVANHPDDADMMFDFSIELNPEILDLYEINTERFVQAQG